ncbi:MAG TPA: hypothetical protein V6D15_11500 [Oculatellaceae cyanobacterium]|jgi:predicted membrane channel-forming protein YqfA (hemolysin III family)
MNSSDKETSQLIEYLYNDYTRLSDQLDSYVKSTFDDFKFLGAIGVLIAWKPIADAVAAKSTHILLLGFISILFIIAIINIRDLLKASIITFYLGQLTLYEAEIKTRLAQPDTKTFHFAADWEKWNDQKHKRIRWHFNLLFYLLILFFPTVVLASQEPRWYAAIYLVIALLTMIICQSAARTL